MKPKSIHYDGVFEKHWLKYLAGLTEKQKEHLRERLAIFDGLVKSQKCPRIVIPVKTGIQKF
jgi:hypothetical protein